MSYLYRAKVPTVGYIGGPGVNVLHFSPGISSTDDAAIVTNIAGDLDDVYEEVKALIVVDATIQCPEFIDKIDVATGNIVDSFPVAEPWDDKAGINTHQEVGRGYALCASLRGDKYINGRRLRGRVFLGPVGYDQTDSAGQTLPAAQAWVINAFTAVVSGLGPRLAIYHRPTSKIAADGDYADVTAVSCPVTPSYLKSRAR